MLVYNKETVSNLYLIATEHVDGFLGRILWLRQNLGGIAWVPPSKWQDIFSLYNGITQQGWKMHRYTQINKQFEHYQLDGISTPTI
jgi:hypothetical protein